MKFITWLGRSVGEPAHAELVLIGIAYRWVVLTIALTVAVVTGSLDEPSEQLAAVGPLALSAFLTWLASRRSLPQWLWVILLADVSIALVCVTATGGLESPLLLYVTAPLVRLALHSWAVPLVVCSAAALVVLTATGVASDAGLGLPTLLNEIALLAALPWLVYATVTRLSASLKARGPLFQSRLEASDLDLLWRVVSGATYPIIADELGVSVETIKVRTARLYRRLGVATRREAIAAGAELGVMPHDLRA